MYVREPANGRQALADSLEVFCAQECFAFERDVVGEL